MDRQRAGRRGHPPFGRGSLTAVILGVVTMI
jgi:hypothetical protein